MLDFLKPYKYVLDAIVIAALVAGAAFGAHRYNTYQQEIGEARIQAQWTKATLIATEAQRQREIQFQKEKEDATAQANKNAQVATAAAAAATQSGRVLDDTIKSLVARSATDNLDANRRYTTALAAVFGECQAAYRQMAKDADGHAVDSLMYQQAWPK